ncbi:unnamed protein product [Closterium sp. Naga37s-1]|nr:unnamed protein product [Closterium sp. Naga37s-1]
MAAALLPVMVAVMELEMLKGHPSIVNLRNAFEDAQESGERRAERRTEGWDGQQGGQARRSGQGEVGGGQEGGGMLKGHPSIVNLRNAFEDAQVGGGRRDGDAEGQKVACAAAVCGAGWTCILSWSCARGESSYTHLHRSPLPTTPSHPSSPHSTPPGRASDHGADVHLIMELCEGGELFDRIKLRGKFPEGDAARVIRTVVLVLRHCHGAGIMHRDLKPENILLVSNQSDTDLKVIDWGVATFFQKGKPCTDMAGSPYYLAPEVLAEKYGPEADIWSAGVVLYILLCGLPPFWGTTNDAIFEAIKQATLNLVRPPWPSISDEAKDLVVRMLTRNPKKRISAEEILDHPWFAPTPADPSPSVKT